MLIRWVPAEIRYIGFFSNFLLMASFLGIGLGILLGRKGARWSLVAFPLLLLVRGRVVTRTSSTWRSGPRTSCSSVLPSTPRTPTTTVLILVVALVTAVMAALAMPLGPLLKSMPPLQAYAIDIIGSHDGHRWRSALMSALGTRPSSGSASSRSSCSAGAGLAGVARSGAS